MPTVKGKGKKKGSTKGESQSSHVVTLTNSNFEKTVSSAELVLVEFYAPWCGGCKRLAPILEEAANELRS
eukprot:COSAG02_NODE_36566_length_453_cov_0.725989_1_plen_69_part_01